MRWTFMAALGLTATGAWAAPAAPNAALARMPVKEITVFKDGNSFVMREGTLPTDASGDVLMDDLPTPVLGTFWVYSTDARAKVVSVSARPRRVLIERTALTLPALLEANPGANVRVDEAGEDPAYYASILGIPERSADELAETSPPNSGERLPEKAGIVLLKTGQGTRVTRVDRIEGVTFAGAVKPTLAAEEFRNLLTVRLEGPARQANSTAKLGMMYVQHGVRWIPSYRVTLDGKGNATVALQATIVNDESDLDNVTMNLVVGVPSFAFTETPDPMSLQQSFAQVAGAMDRAGRLNFGLSNAIMTQGAYSYSSGFGGAQLSPSMPAGPEMAGSERTEDLFLFTVKNLTIRKGERLVVPVSSRTLKYKDVYTLMLPFGPPPELRQGVANEQQAEVARMLAAPKVQHKVRISNDKTEPLTTAPALILRGETVLGQGMMTYTPVEGKVDLAITAAVDVPVTKTERETKRTPDAMKWRNESFARVDLVGNIAIRNHRDEPVDLEVTRYVLGEVDSAEKDGVVEKVNVFDDAAAAEFIRPNWWGYYSWPYWWNNVNGVGRITWKLTLPANQGIDLGYTWHYFWQ